MQIKLVQDSIVFISSLTREELARAKKFVPEACTLYNVDENSKKKTPVCSIAYAEDGSVSENGIVFDSVTDNGFMCKTLVATVGNDPAISTETKVKTLSEEFASLILKMNDLEKQIKKALEDNAAKINAAKDSISVVEL